MFEPRLVRKSDDEFQNEILTFFTWNESWRPPSIILYYLGHPGLDLGGHFFTVRYRWEEQPSLKPHHDNSLYTLNLALNKHGRDFDGGATHFVRQNCTDYTAEPGTFLGTEGV